VQPTAYDGRDHPWRTCFAGGDTLVMVEQCASSSLLLLVTLVPVGQFFCGFEGFLQLENKVILSLIRAL